MSAFPFPKFQVKRDTAAKVAKVANSAETEAVGNQAVTNTPAAKVAKVGSPASRTLTLSQPTTHAAGAPVAPATAVTAVLPPRTELVEPALPARRCYLCASFDRSPFGFPLGLCRQHGDRIQPPDSEPTCFGCGYFELRAPDDTACPGIRNYSRVSTMGGVVNLGCPFPEIMPRRGEHFEPKEVRS